ncbi:MAG TPA: cellulase family glycosylhydrolase [Actinocrinis sp.]|uniref:cellulase family glycosylhydrolase n=1 Tax=Actinocrinis sp. TaxID=1920516 RepID=UPI002DDCAFAE|nr:cellulase family glycosylhydrolase [Actinocrinis sp.]HEV2345533.1 cellulase family glycosylhydrolase [Actinocrinis sp.]
MVTRALPGSRFRVRRLTAAAIAVATAVAGMAIGAVSAVPAAAATSNCTAAYTVTSSWQGGFQVALTVTNNGPAVSSWAVAFRFPSGQTVENGWNGAFSQNGPDVSVVNESYNGALATGASISLGFIGLAGNTNNPPAYFTMNGYACNGAAQVPSVQITTPAPDTTVAPGASLAFAAAASEPTASIAKVEFLENSLLPGASATPTVLATDTAAPYTFTWPAVPAGYYNVTAEAFDSAGVSASSFPIQVSAVSASSTAPQLHVSGSKLADKSGKTVLLHGVDRSGAETNCVQGYGIWTGPVDQPSVTVMKEWGINAVRIPLNEACWNSESYVNAAYAGAAYQSAIKSYVNLLNDNGIVAVLDLHWTDGAYSGPGAGCGSAQATCQKPMPDTAEAVPFWTSVAGAFKGDDSVVFDLFNEPYPSQADANNETEGWQCWLNGGTCAGIGYSVAGMQSLVNAVRSSGADNVLMLGGLSWSNDLTQWLGYEPTDPDNNLAVSWHSYNFNACAPQSCWTSQVAPVIAKVPLVAGEIGENDCTGTFINPLMSWLDSQGGSYLAWTWDAWSGACSSGPVLITDYTGDATAFGAAYEAHLTALAAGS